MVQWIPGLRVVRTYRRQWLVKDVVAGVVLTTLLVPQGMAYAELAGLPPITGLYTSIMCLLGYAVFGPSRILVLGPDSSLGPMIAATIGRSWRRTATRRRAVAYASMLALMVGAITIAAGSASSASSPTFLEADEIGYMNGLALTIVIGQLPKLCGFSVDGDGLIAETGAFVRGVADGEVVAAAAGVGAGALALILLCSACCRRSPGCWSRGARDPRGRSVRPDRHGVRVVGALPQGFRR